MLQTDLYMARLCAALYTNPSYFDFVDDGSQTGICYAIKYGDDFDDYIFRGSDDPEDWKRDFQAEMISIPGIGLVHSGGVKNLTLLKPRKKCRIGGHSLGALRGSLEAGMMTAAGNPPVSVHLYGCPRPGAQELVDILKDVPILSYRNHDEFLADPVTDVPVPFLGWQYEHVRKFIDVECIVDRSLGPPWCIHHWDNYIAALEKLNANV